MSLLLFCLCFFRKTLQTFFLATPFVWVCNKTLEIIFLDRLCLGFFNRTLRKLDSATLCWVVYIWMLILRIFPDTSWHDSTTFVLLHLHRPQFISNWKPTCRYFEWQTCCWFTPERCQGGWTWPLGSWGGYLRITWEVCVFPFQIPSYVFWFSYNFVDQ